MKYAFDYQTVKRLKDIVKYAFDYQTVKRLKDIVYVSMHLIIK